MKSMYVKWLGIVLVASAGLVYAAVSDGRVLSKEEMMTIRGGFDFDCSDCQSNGDCAGRNGGSMSYGCESGTAGWDCYDCTTGGNDETCDDDGGTWGWNCEVLPSQACGDLEKGICTQENHIWGCYERSDVGDCSNDARKCRY